MARQRSRGTIKNSHLIGAGRTFQAVRNANKSINWRASVVQQRGGVPKRNPKQPRVSSKGVQHHAKRPTVKVTGSKNRAIKTQAWKSSPVRFSRFKTAAAKQMKQTPKTRTTQIKRTPPKPPKRGR